MLEIKERADIMTSGLLRAMKMGHALGGGVVWDNAESGVRKQSLHRSGLSNIFWRADWGGVAYGIYGSRGIPIADQKKLAQKEVPESSSSSCKKYLFTEYQALCRDLGVSPFFVKISL